MALQSLFRTTTALKINPADVTLTLATVPTVTAGRIRIYSAKQEELISFTGVSGSTITGCTRNLSLTADPATGGTGLTWVAGSQVELVAMHDQIFDKSTGGTITGSITVTNDVTVNDDLTVVGDTVMGTTFKEPVYANAAARDAAISSPSNGMSVYLTAEGYFTDYQGGVWNIRSTGTAVGNATTTVAGKVELATLTEARTGISTGGTGAALSLDPSQASSYFGDGSDGDVTISTNTTLTRDMYYNNLTVNTGVTLDPAGYRIFVYGTTTLTGTAKIIRTGNAGSVGADSGAGGAGGAGGAALTTGTCGPNTAGGTGGTGGGATSAAGTSVNPSYATTATAAAKGGNGGSGTSAGNGGTATQGAFYNTVNSLMKILGNFMFPAQGLVASLTTYSGMPGASGGGASAGTSGGGGGGGGSGGIIFIATNTIAGTGTIEAIGGAGGAGGNGTTYGGGGGGGGSGGVAIIVYRTGTPWTCTLTGGAGGALGTGGSGNGTAGSTGTVGQSILINV